MSVTWRLAWRNLWRHSRRTWLTVSAMVFCNALLVFMNSFQYGSYRMMIDGTLALLTGHLQVQHTQYNEEPRMRYSIPDGVALAQRLREGIGVDAMAARGLTFALASSEERSFGVQIIGVQPSYEPLVSTLPGLVKQGRYLEDNTAEEIVIGEVLARNLKVSLGSEITLLGSGRDGSFAAAVATVVGIIDSGVPDADRSIAQLPLGYFQDVFAMEGHVHSIAAKLDTLSAVDDTVNKVRALISDPDIVVLDWDALQPGLRQGIQADMASASFIYIILVALVGFSVLNTQLMSVLERTREFGVMMALGLRPGGLGRLVLLETAVMSVLGLVLGAGLGALVSFYYQSNGIAIPGMEEAMARYNLPGVLYPEVSSLSVFGAPSAVFIVGMLAAVYPALRLHRLEPVAAMRAV